MSFLAALGSAIAGSAGGASLGSSIIGGIGQGISSGLSGLAFGMSGTRRQMRKQQQYALEQMKVQNQYAQEQMKLQSDLNKQQYNYEFEMESPASRAQQLRDAGLNPALMYGGGSAGAGMQGSVGTVSTPSGPSGSSIGGSYMQPSLGEIARMSLIGSEIRANDALAEERLANAAEKRGETPESGERITSMKLSNQLKDITMSNDILKSTFELDELSVRVANMRKEGLLTDKKASHYEAMIETEQQRKLNLMASTQNINADTKLLDEKVISERYSRYLEYQRLKLQREGLDAQIKRYDAQNELDRKRASQVDAEIEKIGKQMKLTEEQIKQLKHQRHLNWAKFGVNTAISVSAEARSWITFGLAKGATPIPDGVTQDIPGQPYKVSGSDGDYMFAD